MAAAVLGEIVNAKHLMLLHINMTAVTVRLDDFAFKIAGDCDYERDGAEEQRGRFFHD